MNEFSKTVIELEKEYFNLIYELFHDLIQIFTEDNISIDEAVKKYLSKQQNAIFVPRYKDNYAFKRKQLFERNMEFWNRNKDMFIKFISKEKNVGIFGVGDSTFTPEYLNEIKRNSLFYDVLVFNDPFYTYWSSDKELHFDYNINKFYKDILYIWETKCYLSIEENEVFIIIFPFDSLLTNEEKTNIIRESRNAAISWINEIFDITVDIDNVVSDIEKVKNLSIEKIQRELYRNGIYINYLEALNYSQDLLKENVKKEIEKFCFQSWGMFNKDFVRCLLTLEALPTMAATSYYAYKLHFLLALRLKSNPIMSRNEWAPMQRELKEQLMRASSDYMYTCAIHRNDQMATLMELDYDEIVRYHNKKQCAEFRNFFYKATSEIVNTFVNVDEIANEVFSKTDDLLMNEYNNILHNRKKTRKNAIIGFFKGTMGYVPMLSYAISAYDTVVSAKDFVQTLNNKESLIEHLNNRRTISE